LRFLAALLVALVADYLLFPLLARPAGPPLNRGENGLWLRHTWYRGRWRESEMDALARRLRDGQIRYAYFHVRHVQSDGSLRYREAASAKLLLAALRQRAPGVRALAWIYAGNDGRGGLPIVDPARPEVRRGMAETARWLVQECGFDGVQWDYEVCQDGNPALPTLLRETRLAWRTAGLDARRPLLSVATGLWAPPGLRRWGWSDAYFRAVARECDQLTVMGYDSGMYLPRAYAWLISEQVARVTQAAALANPDCRVLIGIPTYAWSGPSHHAHAENAKVALLGVRDGLARRETQRKAFAGVALFADYTTQPDEWQQYQQLWLQPMESGKRP
jgi:hypothetical protein